MALKDHRLHRNPDGVDFMERERRAGAAISAVLDELNKHPNDHELLRSQLEAAQRALHPDLAEYIATEGGTREAPKPVQPAPTGANAELAQLRQQFEAQQAQIEQLLAARSNPT